MVTESNPTSLAKNILIVASGKGGVGKTWFAISLAHALAKRNRKVLIFDGDLGLANVDIQLGLTPQKDVVHFLQGACSLQDAITTYENIDILTGRSGSGALANLDPVRRTFLKQNLLILAKKYDILIVDLGAGIDQTVQSLTNIGKHCFVITTDEPTAMTDAYAFIKVVQQNLSTNINLHVVVNKAENEKEGMKTYQTLAKVCENFLKKVPNFGGIIRNDPRVRDSIRNQTSIFQRFPNSFAAQDIEQIIPKILNEMGLSTPENHTNTPT